MSVGMRWVSTYLKQMAKMSNPASGLPIPNRYQILYERLFEGLMDIHEAGGMDRQKAVQMMKRAYIEFGIDMKNPNTDRVIGRLFIGIINAANRRTRCVYWGDPKSAYETAEKVLQDIGNWHGWTAHFRRKQSRRGGVNHD